MRTLEFVVDGQRLTKDKNCDFSNIVAGSVGYLKAKFNFSHEWDGCKKAASFWIGDNYEHEVAALLDLRNECVIPSDALQGDSFKVSVTGMKNNYQITSSKTKVNQEVY